MLKSLVSTGLALVALLIYVLVLLAWIYALVWVGAHAWKAVMP